MSSGRSILPRASSRRCATKVIVDLAEKHSADVLVMGNKGMSRKVLGSVPDSVSHKAGSCVLIVKTT